MTEQERNGRAVAVGDICLSFFIWGSGYETFPIFFPALLKYFDWSKAQLGLMSMAFLWRVPSERRCCRMVARPDGSALGDGRGSHSCGWRVFTGKPYRFIFYALRRQPDAWRRTRSVDLRPRFA